MRYLKIIIEVKVYYSHSPTIRAGIQSVKKKVLSVSLTCSGGSRIYWTSERAATHRCQTGLVGHQLLSYFSDFKL